MTVTGVSLPQYVRSVKENSTSTVSHIQTKTDQEPGYTGDLGCLLPIFIDKSTLAIPYPQSDQFVRHCE